MVGNWNAKESKAVGVLEGEHTISSSFPGHMKLQSSDSQTGRTLQCTMLSMRTSKWR